MVALLFGTGELIHDAFLSDIEVLFIDLIIAFAHRPQGILLLVDDLIDDHLEILAGRAPLLLDGLDLLPHFVNLIISLSNSCKFAFDPVSKLFLKEKKLTVIEVIILFKVRVHHSLLVLLPHGVMIIFLQKNLTLPLEFLEVIEKRRVDLLDPIDNDCNKNIIRSCSFLNQQIYVVGDTL